MRLTPGSDGSLDRRENGSTGDSHDQESSGSSSVSSEVFSRDDEDDGVWRRRRRKGGREDASRSARAQIERREKVARKFAYRKERCISKGKIE